MADDQTVDKKDLVGNDGAITETEIRLYLRDGDPTKNLLLNDYKFSHEEIRLAWTQAVDAWNDEPPVILGANRNRVTIEFRSKVLQGAVAKLFYIAAEGYRGNHLKYNLPGGSVDDQDKFTIYEQAGDKHWKEYMDFVRRMKRSINISTGWGQF